MYSKEDQSLNKELNRLQDVYFMLEVAKLPWTVATSFVDVKVKTSAGSIVTFSNFPVGEYLPVQVLQLYATGTDAAADNNCLAIW